MVEVAANAVVSVSATPSKDGDDMLHGLQVLFTPSEHGGSKGTLDMIDEIISSELLTAGFQELMDVAETSSLVGIHNGIRKMFTIRIISFL